MQRAFVILDFGSQFTQLIARRFRELGFYSEIHSYQTPLEKIKALHPYGIILSGGPNSVYEENSPKRSVRELLAIAPIMGVCYGMQLITQELGGKVRRSQEREYGLMEVDWEIPLKSVPHQQKVWMSHGDIVEEAPPDFEVMAWSKTKHPAAMRGPNIFAVQFHPEVSHSEHGLDVLSEFAQAYCGAEPDWDSPHILTHLEEEIQKKVGPLAHVLVGLSGGVDSTVVATLLTKVLGRERVHCVFIDNGLLRKNEYVSVLENYSRLNLNVHGVDAADKFLNALKGLADPEVKRKTIGRVFIEVFEEVLPKLPKVEFLAQGTLYPDVIESVSSMGGSVTIKSHHNVGGLPEKMKLKLVEPVRELFKDEVRAIGEALGIGKDFLWRHPFPGPGLAIRVIGEVNVQSLAILREADDIFISYLKEKQLYDKIWQAFCVLLPISSVGVQGDARTYDQVLALRAVTSKDGMTADWFNFSFEDLREVSNRITNKVRGINRVVYDITSKPPGTIEWE